MARETPVVPTISGSIQSQTLVVDPGANTIKAGLVSSQDPAAQTGCHVIPNCIARSRTKQTYVGSSLSQCNDFGEIQFKRPVERGYIVNWDLERAIFEHEFFDPKAKLYCDPASTNLLLTEHSNGPAALSTNADQIIFEEFSFASAYRVNGPSLNALNPLPPSLASPSAPSSLPIEILLLIDSSHSHTTITPLLRGRPIPSGIRRLDIGGKHISNHLASLISLRHFSLMDEPHIISQIKEDACFVAPSFSDALEATWRGPRSDRRPPSDIVADYILPDYARLHRGYLRPRNPSSSLPNTQPPSTQAMNTNTDKEKEESFPLSTERFVPPELLFSPHSLVSLSQSGLPGTIMQSLAPLPRSLWQGLLGNIVLVGGNALLPGFRERLEEEVRAIAPSEFEVRVGKAVDPIRATWEGGRRVAEDRGRVGRCMVGREEYFEYGEGWVQRRFRGARVVENWGGEGNGNQRD
ncbi:hypothetical protein KVT40_000097 [Elsinoe batatas]|uniref:Actin-like protein ARP6 n=1 Tax=Elsinoe batatas TaxID=2601811 RepID=A0A8K0L8N1_9PEZI|nr:hypothetical protein KVT40_000097 [Elsinoe batatas]